MDMIRDKVRKLLQLATSDNQNEAALAMSMAQSLIDKYNLEMIELSEKEVVKFEEIIEAKEPLYVGGRIPGWKSILAGILARHNNCRIIIQKGMGGASSNRETHLKIYGRETDIDHVRYMFAYALDQLTRLSYIPCVGEGHRFKDSWYHGAVMGIKDKLDESKKEVLSNSSQFTVNKYNQLGTDVDDFIKSKYSKLRSCKCNSKLDSSAFSNGRKTGREISLNNKHSSRSSIGMS